MQKSPRSFRSCSYLRGVARSKLLPTAGNFWRTRVANRIVVIGTKNGDLQLPSSRAERSRRYTPEIRSSTAMLKQTLDRTTSRGSKARARPIHKGVNPAIEVERAASARAL